MSRQTRISPKKSSSVPPRASFKVPPVIQPKVEKKPDAKLPEWKPGGGGAVSPLQRLIDSKAAQAKLTIGQPNDNYEQEADRVARNVVQRINSSVSDSPQQEETVQRETAENLQTKLMLQRQEAVGGGEASSELESSINRAKSSGQPLDSSLQQSMGQAMGADFSGVRVHTDSQADRLNRSIQARAFTTGSNVFFKKGEYNPGTKSGQELIAHELTHTIQQGAASIQRQPQASIANRTSYLQAKPLQIQRYTTIKSGSKEYPAKKEWGLFSDSDATTDNQFFVSQEEQNDSFLSDEKDSQGTYLPNLVCKSTANLMISDNCDLAIEDTSGEPKNFFATTDLVKSANSTLKSQGGKVELVMTDRYLLVNSGSTAKKLYQVQPSVSTGMLSSDKGTDVRTPQRCNEMADFVSGSKGADLIATTKVNVVLANILDQITGNEHKYAETLATKISNATKTGGKAFEAYFKFVGLLSTEFRRLIADKSTKERMNELLKTANVNEFMTPEIGDAIVTISATTPEEADSRDKDNTFLYHFGTVVAKSGPDYITMENYARREEKNQDKLSAGDPLFFFKMYGTKKDEKTWHGENLKTGAFIGAVLSFVVK